ncbi:tetratricopeptide repeat protein [Flavobacterium hauense]
MLKSIGHIVKIAMAVFVFTNAFSSFAQRDPKIDALLKQAKFDIYEKPESVIKLGDSLYNSPKSSPETKVDALMLISDAYSSKRDYKKSLKYFHIANELTKKENNPDLQILVLSRTAVRYQQMKVYDKAIQYLDECDKLIAINESKKDYRYTKGNNYVVRGLIYKDQLNCDIAINYFNKGIQIYKTIASSVINTNESIVYYNMGNCYVLISDYEKAEKSFNQAIISADVVDANSLKAFALKGLSEVYNAQGNYQKAIEVLHEALKISKNVGDLVLNRGLYINLAGNYKAIDNWAEYQKYNQLFLKNQTIIKESERQSIGDSIDELTVINDEKLSKMQIGYYVVIALEILLSAIFIYMLVSYQKRSHKSIVGLNFEIKRIKDGFKKEIHE